MVSDRNGPPAGVGRPDRQVVGRSGTMRGAGTYIPMDRLFIAVIASAVLLLLTSAALLIYRTGNSPGEMAEATKGFTTVGMKR